MRLSQLVLSVCLLATGIGSQRLQAADPTTTPSGLSVAMDFAPIPANAAAYSCRAVITDLATGETLAKPDITVLKGETGKAQIGSDTSALILEVLVNKSATAATFRVTYSKSGKVVAIQKGSITLR